MNEFKSYHPFVNFIYFLCVIGFSMFLMHPLSLGIALLCAISYTFVLKGKKSAFRSILMIIPIILITAVINPLFNHAGVTILEYFPSGNPLTAESVCYGIAAGTMLAAVILYFSCYNAVMTSDKFIYLFGKIIPTLSLVFSMILRFVPNLISRIKEITNTQKTLGRDISKGNIIKRLKCAMKILSILVTWSLENAIDTADSMKSRGYGLPGRTAYSNFRFERRDVKVLLWMMVLSGITVAGIFGGYLSYNYFPIFEVEQFTPVSCFIHLSYFLLCMTPIIIEWREEYRWKAIE